MLISSMGPLSFSLRLLLISGVAVSIGCIWKVSPQFTAGIEDGVYTTTLSISDKSFVVKLDTGSADFWVGTQHLGLSPLVEPSRSDTLSSISYIDGTQVSGVLAPGMVAWGPYSQDNQSFVSAPGASKQLPSQQYQGILGLAPLPAGGAEGTDTSLMQTVLGSDPEIPNFITFLSSTGPGANQASKFTIGEIVKGFADINSAPKLATIASNSWSTSLDAVIVNGERLPGNADRVQPVLTATLDTGTTTATAPRDIVDAIYGGLPGSRFDGHTQRYELPCSTKLNISFVFSGYAYPTHPVYAVIPAKVSQDGRVICHSAFQYTPSSSDVDFILGNSFLRNVYSLFYFGHSTRPNDVPPYMQLMSIIDVDDAWSSFDSLSETQQEEYLARHFEGVSSVYAIHKFIPPAQNPAPRPVPPPIFKPFPTITPLRPLPPPLIFPVPIPGASKSSSSSTSTVTVSFVHGTQLTSSTGTALASSEASSSSSIPPVATNRAVVQNDTATVDEKQANMLKTVDRNSKVIIALLSVTAGFLLVMLVASVKFRIL